MNWLEIIIPVEGKDIDLLSMELEEMGVSGMVIEDETDFNDFLEHNHQYWDYVDEALSQQFSGCSQIKFYLPEDAEGHKLLDAVSAVFSPKVSKVADADWENNWREHYKPLPIGDGLLIVPAWETVTDTERVILRLDPGLIFGTGSHATTRMCLCEIQTYACKAKRVLDLGCGSGILGIAALLLGCSVVYGCDIDPKAPEVAASNAMLNEIYEDRFQIFSGNILEDEALQEQMGSGHDIVLANIVADVIIPLAPMIPKFLAPNGVFICSGIIDGREEEVKHALQMAGLHIVHTRNEEEWYCFTAISQAAHK